ncbi:ATP-binding protein [Streptomyces sp. NPDC019224]|uniref:ATP-binding protein n=1 Tax=Streptomyces sp. NPDC019224 TaxID=3154484 RepID=UPI0033E00BD2
MPRKPESTAAARRLTDTALCRWELEELVEDGALVMSELMAKAVQHGCRESSRVAVERVIERRVRVAITDFSRALPVECRAEDGDESGRGLLLVAAPASDGGEGHASLGQGRVG